MIQSFFFHWKKKGEKYSFLIETLRDHVLLMTSCLVTIAADCRQALPKCVSRTKKELLKTA